MLECSPEILAETFRTALQAEDLQTTDAMFQVFDEVRTLWDVDFYLHRRSSLELKVARDDNTFILTPTDVGWLLIQFKNHTRLLETIDPAEIVKHLCTLVYP